MKNILKNICAIFSILVLLGFAPFAFAADGPVAADFSSVQTALLATLALAGALGVALSTGSLAWDVGISLLKKFGKKGAR